MKCNGKMSRVNKYQGTSQKGMLLNSVKLSEKSVKLREKNNEEQTGCNI